MQLLPRSDEGGPVAGTNHCAEACLTSGHQLQPGTDLCTRNRVVRTRAPPIPSISSAMATDSRLGVPATTKTGTRP